jgi:diguanylate cyclase (GGDEF)-like protein/PAS domain S-box-containing protein
MLFFIRKKIYSILKINEKNRLKYECIKISLIYLTIGFFWVYFSDRLANKLASNNVMLLIISTYKGCLYVIVTSTILYLLISNILKKVDLTENKLNESYKELISVNEELEAYVQQLTVSEEELRVQYDQIIENEKKLSKSEEKYKTLVNEMQQGLALYEVILNEEGEAINYSFLDGNESHEKLIRLKNKDILGKTILEIFPSTGNEIIKLLQNVIKTGEPICCENYLKELDKYMEVIAYRPKPLQLAAIVTDITARKQAEDAVKASEYTFRNLFEGSSDAILIIEDNKIIDCNPAMIELLGYDSKVRILGKSPCEFSPEKQPDGKPSKEKADEVFKSTIKNGKFKFEWWYEKNDGSSAPVEVMMTTIVLNGKKVFHCLWRDISQRKQMEQRLEYLSYHDQLTGLYNRRFFEEELNRLDVERNLPLTIIMADVNGLKLVNDSFGHAIGDELLKKVVEVIIKGCRKEDIIARLAGDEFVILLPKTGIYEGEKIVKNIKDLALKEKVGSVDISISFGYEAKSDKEEKILDILKKAEDHMYKKKLFESPSMRGKTINAIITTLHEKNKREEQHSYRVSKLCESMGKALGLSEDDIKELKTVGLLHDIGKIAIEENILNKKEKLTDEEWEEIKRHPEIGYRILSTVNDMSEMSEYVLAHHERWDGIGYPKGLKGEEIPLQSRIITIADSYDAMISERSYRNALPEEVAIKELKINEGIQFDPRLIRLFIEKVLNKPFD